MKKVKKEIVEVKTTEEIERMFESVGTGYNKKYILNKAYEEAEKHGGTGEFNVTADTNYYKAVTMLEFNHGILLSNSVTDLHSSFAIEFFQNLLKEFDCKTPSEKSLAETVALNFVRILETQRKIKDNQKSVKTRYDVQYISVLSKELDRAERHYLTSLQTLRMYKMPQLAVNINTQNAFVGNNQVLQKNEII